MKEGASVEEKKIGQGCLYKNKENNEENLDFKGQFFHTSGPEQLSSHTMCTVQQ